MMAPFVPCHHPTGSQKKSQIPIRRNLAVSKAAFDSTERQQETDRHPDLLPFALFTPSFPARRREANYDKGGPSSSDPFPPSPEFRVEACKSAMIFCCAARVSRSSIILFWDLASSTRSPSLERRISAIS